jgi:cysteine synthase A
MSLPLLPTLEELLHPATQPAAVRARARASTDPLDPIHLFDMTWRRLHADGRVGAVTHMVLPRALTGTRASVVVMCGLNFPTGSHKVGPAYSIAREKLVSGEIVQDGSTLVFPSTGNFGIGGAWVGPRLGFRSLVVLPAEMSAERFEKIRAYGAEINATPGSESNVKEIYDRVAQLRADPQNRILNQFAEMGNYRFHHHVTGGSAVELARELQAEGIGNGRIAAFVSAMGSAGTIAAGDRIKAEWSDAKVVAVEPVQCPTLYNVGYGSHAIEGIGDKHVTWIHNVRNTDLLVCVDDQQCLEALQLVEEGQDTLAAALGLDPGPLSCMRGTFGVSAMCNILAAIQTAHYYDMGEGELLFTAATDNFDRYPSVLRRLDATVGPQTDAVARRRIGIFHDQRPNMVLEGTMPVRRRWHNQKYFTWVEQQGHTVEALEALWSPATWAAEAARVPELDRQTLALRPSGI